MHVILINCDVMYLKCVNFIETPTGALLLY